MTLLERTTTFQMTSSLSSSWKDSNLALSELWGNKHFLDPSQYNKREMNPQRAKMIIAGLVLIRGFIYQIIMQAWDIYKIDKKKLKVE